MPNIRGQFADQDDLIVTAQVQTSNNNQTAFTAAILEVDHLRGTTAALQPSGLVMTLADRVPSVLGTAQGTIGAAVAGIGQEGTPSQEPGGGGNPCPEIHQFVLIRSDINTPIPVQVQYVEKGMYLWNPITGTFEKIIRADVVENQALWDVGKWAVGSFAAPIIQSLDDTKGLALSKCGDETGAVMVSKGPVKETRLPVTDLQTKGTVKHLETEGPTHIFAHGTLMELMLLFHNLKPQEGRGGGE